MKLAIIAGGKGSRLGLQNIPKPMVLIGDKPILELQIELGKCYGINEIFILSGYLSEQIVNYFGDGAKWDLQIHHIVEKSPLGTAGAIKQLEPFINEPFIVFYGDTILDIDLHRFYSFSLSQKNIATIFVHPNDHPYDSDLVEIDDNHYVKYFFSKPHDPEKYYFNLVNAALYVLSPEIFAYIPENVNLDFGKNVFPNLLHHNEPILAYKTAEYIKDMGTEKRLAKTCQDYFNGKTKRLNNRNCRNAIFLDRDGVINKEVGNLSKVDDFELLPSVATAIKKINSSDFLAIVITNQPVIAKGMCTVIELANIHKKMETLLGIENAYLDHLYYCPHHPDKGFIGENIDYKIDCDCRKPKIGLLERAKNDYNIDFQNSFFIGDSTTDLQTAKNSAIKSVLIRTGHAGQDGKFHIRPDFIFDDLNEAVDFIVNKFGLIQKLVGQIIPFLKDAKTESKLPVICIGGLSRSGKSLIAKCIDMILSREGIKSTYISLDNWIISIEKRHKSMTVQSRFQYNQIEKDIRFLFDNKSISINEYDYLTRSVTENKMYIDITQTDTLIIDGLVALDIEYIRNISSVKLYIECNESTRKNRFINFYTYKGLINEEINTLYQQREFDENCYISKTKKFADFVINLDTL